ncbi:MAG: hypothetical protein H7061_04270 [Bdellovibrionaceae bacterium]|nr:hypothetical protein [Bdellovibrio sp.]
MLNHLSRRKLILINTLAFSLTAQADWLVGGYFGFGGTGISTIEKFNGVDLPVERSESPGVYGLFIERSLSDNSSIALDHTSGFTLSPFSSGVEFNGFTYKYFYPGEMPSVKYSKENSTLMVQRFETFVGGSFGIARGNITREKDAVPSTSGSGVYFGGRLGVDYQIAPGIVNRSEMIFGASMAPSGFAKAKLSEFGLVTGLYYIW